MHSRPRSASNIARRRCPVPAQSGADARHVQQQLRRLFVAPNLREARGLRAELFDDDG